MAKLPTRVPTIDLIFDHIKRVKNEPPRTYLGASQLGQPCERRLWYSFRWAAYEIFEGRMLRLFDTGHREEQRVIDELRAIGVTVWDKDDTTGEQIRFKAIEGHSGGGCDGVAKGFVEAPKTYHVLEIKTMNAKHFGEFHAKGVAKSHPIYYTQFTMYAGWGEFDRIWFHAKNKDDDDMHAERINFDKPHFIASEAKARRVIYSPEPLPKISEDAAWYECKFCPAHSICHGKELAPVNCRTCIHSTPEKDGDARWSCAFHKKDLSVAEQRAGCEHHRYIPHLVRYAKLIDADPEANWIEYEIVYKGQTIQIRNGNHGLHSYASSELRAASPAAFFDPMAAQIRAELGGKITAYETGEQNV